MGNIIVQASVDDTPEILRLYKMQIGRIALLDKGASAWRRMLFI